jgi:hypothetical protein
MAYPVAPSYRIPYELDGSYCFYSPTYNFTTGATALTQNEKELLNNESTSWDYYNAAGNDLQRGVGIIFPAPVNIVGMFLAWHSSNPAIVSQWSSDTTNGFDGTWNNVSVPSASSVVFGGYRSVSTVNIPNAKGYRLGVSAFTSAESMGISAIHLYGTSSNSGLYLWDSTLSQRPSPSYLDFGDVVRGTTVTKQFRVKNLSGSTANGVSISTSIYNDSSPSITSKINYSTDGVTYTPSISIGNLAPNQESSVFFMRYTTSPNDQIGPWAPRVRMSAASWS